MNNLFAPKMTPIDEEINHILTKLADMDPKTKEYTDSVNNLKTLCEARSQKTSNTISADTIVMGAVNLLGILLILNHEKFDVITTKSLGFISRLRT